MIPMASKEDTLIFALSNHHFNLDALTGIALFRGEMGDGGIGAN